jgi:hypothetical protein
VAEPVDQLVLLGSCRQRLGGVEDPAVVDHVVDGGQALVGRGGQQVDGVDPAGPPGRGHGHRVGTPAASLDGPLPDRRLVAHLGAEALQLIGDEPDDVLRRDPGSARSGVDVQRGQLDRHDGGECIGVRLPAVGVGARGALGDGQLRPYVARQVLAGGDEVAGRRVLPDEHAELGTGAGRAVAEQLGDAVEVGVAPLVEADRQRVGRRVGGRDGLSGGYDPAGENGGALGSLAFGIEHFERQQGGVVGIRPEAAHGGAKLALAFLSGLRIEPAGADQLEPVQSTEARHVGVVLVTELALEAGEHGVVVARRLRADEREHGVTQIYQVAELSPVLYRLHQIRLWDALCDDHEAATGGVAMNGSFLTPYLAWDGRWELERRGIGWDERQVTIRRRGDEVAQRPVEIGPQVAGSSDDEVLVSVLSPSDAHLAKDLVGMVEEPAVDRHAPAGQLGLGDLEPGWIARGVGRRTPTQDQQVADRVSACRCGEGAGWQANGADELGQFADVAARLAARSVKGVPGRDDRHQPAEANQIEGLDDEVVVDEGSAIASDAGLGPCGVAVAGDLRCRSRW